MKKNFVIAVIIVLLAFAIVAYSFNRQYPTYNNQDNNLLTNKNVITHNVEIRASEFYPPKLIVSKGEKVIWVNNDNSPHTITFADENLTSGIIPPNQTYYHIFENEGSFAYNCSLRPILSGEIDVGPVRYNP
jgi:plastocyanin